MSKEIVIFDLDGTLADIGHRKDYLEEDEVDWKSFFEECHKDSCYIEIVRLSQLLYNETSYNVEIWTGRSDIVEDKTRNWLDEFSISYDNLKMRPKDDHRPDYDLKKGWARDFDGNIVLIFEDRLPVIEMWESEGEQVIPVNQRRKWKNKRQKKH